MATGVQVVEPHGPVVLVIDDDPAVARLVTLCLEDDGLSVVTAADGMDAIVRKDEVQPDAIVLDLEMPGMDGVALFRHLRSRGGREPVLILSAYGARRVARDLGADDAMEKPFDPDELVRRVRALVHCGEHEGPEHREQPRGWR